MTLQANFNDMDIADESKGTVVKFNRRKRVPRPRGVTDDLEDLDQSNEQPGHTSPAAAPEPAPTQNPISTEASAPLPDMLRSRKLTRPRRRFGIEFAHTRTSHHDQSSISELEERDMSLQPSTDPEAATTLAQARFAAQTGTVADVGNRHMTSYIDTEMAKLRQGAIHSSALPHGRREHDQENSSSSGLPNLPQRQPAALGQIQEIDLGPESTSKNIEMTEMATRRLANGQLNEETPTHAKPRKPRKRRGSDDIRRDQVVEAFLHENKLDIYDDAANDPQEEEQGQEAADDLIAEQFQRDFLDAVQSRNKLNRARKRAAPAGQKKGQVDEKSRGPKLGGSRSARAAMHAAGKVKPGPAKR